MKKFIIISGPLGSGKTHIATAIEMQYDSDIVYRVPFSTTSRKTDFCGWALIVIDNIPENKIQKAHDRITAINPHANIVFTTQDDVIHADWKNKAHVINCRNAYL